MTWSDTFLHTLKENDVRLVNYVPDNVLTPLIGGAAADNYFMSVCATREDEAIATLAGAYMGGLRGVVMMQTSGAGIADSHWVRDEAHFDELTSRRFDEGGPLLLAAKIDDKPGTVRSRAHPPPLHAGARDRTRERVGPVIVLFQSRPHATWLDDPKLAD